MSAGLNILLVLADDHGADDLGCAGNADVRTPHLDRLAGDGVRLTRHFTPEAMCAPARSTIYTGRYPHRHGCHRNHASIRKGVQTIGRLMAPPGYRVGLIGKTHVAPLEQFGFDHVDRFEPKDVLDWISRDSSRPFCAVVALKEPHSIDQVKAFPVPTRINPANLTLPPYLVDAPETRRQRAGYLELVEALDAKVGAIRSGLEERGLTDETLVIYTSDHGAGFPFEKWTLYEAGLRVPFLASWPGSIPAGTTGNALTGHIDLLPTLLEVAGDSEAAAGMDGRSLLEVLRGNRRRHSALVFGTHTNDGIQNGESYSIRSVRDERYKLIANLDSKRCVTNNITAYKGEQGGFREWEALAPADPFAVSRTSAYLKRPPLELYDLERDPCELTNLAGEPEVRDVLLHLHEELQAWMEQQGDPFRDALSQTRNQG